MDYALHSIARDNKFRSHRAQLPSHMRKKHYIGSGEIRLMTGRRLIVHEGLVLKHLDELKTKVAAHILEVRTLDGRLVDLSTMEAGPAAPLAVLPHPKLDSAADDLQVGQYIPPYVGDDLSMPQVMAHGAKPALVKEADLEVGATATDAVLTSDADLEAAVDAATAAATGEDDQAPADLEPSAVPAQEEVSSKEQGRMGKRNRR